VLLEAMASGVPVVSTAVMGTKDILEPKRGAFVSREDVIEFADKVSFLLKNKFLQKQLSIEARRYSAEWSIQSLTGKMIAFYERVAKKSHQVELDTEEIEKKETAKVTV
jgi:glycosyltransferase involved in cell wall biosynthesis